VSGSQMFWWKLVGVVFLPFFLSFFPACFFVFCLILNLSRSETADHQAVKKDKEKPMQFHSPLAHWWNQPGRMSSQPDLRLVQHEIYHMSAWCCICMHSRRLTGSCSSWLPVGVRYYVLVH